jgi:predicted dehydrogenase
MRVGIVGTGAIAAKHAEAYRNIGFELVACTNASAQKGAAFAAQFATEFVPTVAALAAHPRVEMIDVCTLPSYRLEAVELAARHKKHVLVEKPMAIDLATAHAMMRCAEQSGVRLGVVSQHRFDDSIQFLRGAIADGRLGKVLEADAYVKWFRSAEYYSRAIKGSWEGEGGGALINQAVHQLDMLLYLLGPVERVAAMWQLGALHDIESDDVLNALLRYASGATGVLQASTAMWPGDAERLEVHGTKGTAVITGDKLSAWNVQEDAGETPALAAQNASGASDPMAISTLPLERLMRNFAEACESGGEMVCSAEDGYRALQLVTAIYAAARNEVSVDVAQVAERTEVFA